MLSWLARYCSFRIVEERKFRFGSALAQVT
jgi:hypothetical protein